MKISGRNIESFLASPPANVRAVLIYGPDAGLVRERGDRLVEHVAGDLNDPFRVAELSPDEVLKDAGRLFEEAAAIAMTGGRRAIRLRGAVDNLSDLLDRFLEDPLGDGLLVFEGGDLPPRSRLRKRFESADGAAALPCYRDEGSGLEAVIDEMARSAGFRIDREARIHLAGNLGGDRLLTRREMEKLLLYMGEPNTGGREEITLEDVQACVGDSAERTLDDLVFALGDGNLGDMEQILTRLFQEGTNWVAPLRAAARHLERLHRVAGSLREGATVEGAMARLRPPVFWKYRGRFQRQAQRWSPDQVTAAISRLAEAELEGKRGRAPGEAVTTHALFAVAVQGRRPN